MDVEPFTVKIGFLLIRINMIRAILSQGVEQSGVVIHYMVPLLKVMKLLQLAAEQTHRKMMSTEGYAEFIPCNLMILR
jgi:hypothetical protein